MAEPAAISVAPEEALAFLRAKGFRLDPSFDWRDWQAARHAGAFTVAKSTGFDILGDIHAAVDDAIANGTTLEDFRKRLTPILQEKGWWGRREVVDPVTGEMKMAQLGSPRRLATIFNTNLRMAYMAGKWQRMMRVAEKRPWLRYITVRDERVRLTHRSWHGMTLRYDDPWWDTHYPPNGFNCRCDVQQWSDRDIKRLGFEPFRPGGPTSLPRRHVNRRTGEVMEVPDGIQPGFAHNVGRLGLDANTGKQLMDKLAALPPDLAAAAGQAAESFALSGVSYEFLDWARKAAETGKTTGSLRVIGVLRKSILQAMATEGQQPYSAAIAITDKMIWHLKRDTKPLDLRISMTDVFRLPQLLTRPKAILRDRRDGAFLYVFDPPEPQMAGKLVLHVDWHGKLPRDVDDERPIVKLNVVKSASVVPLRTLADPKTYDVIEGAL